MCQDGSGGGAGEVRECASVQAGGGKRDQAARLGRSTSQLVELLGSGVDSCGEPRPHVAVAAVDHVQGYQDGDDDVEDEVVNIHDDELLDPAKTLLSVIKMNEYIILFTIQRFYV